MVQDNEKLSFEETLKELEEIVTKLESGELSLEEALELFERGQMLAARCSAQLESAALRIEMLTADGELVSIGDD